MNFVFFDKNGKELVSTPCKSLFYGSHNYFLFKNIQPQKEMNSIEMALYTEQIHKYIIEFYPWILEGNDPEDWRYTPDYQLFHQVMSVMNHEHIKTYYERELDKIKYFTGENDIYDLWKIRNIYELMQKYSNEDGHTAKLMLML
jgi:hypothetical protein